MPEDREVEITLYQMKQLHEEQGKRIEKHSAILANHDEILDKHSEILLGMRETSKETRDATVAMKDILEAWNSTQGFLRGAKAIGTLARWIFVTGVAISAIVYFLKTGMWK